MKRRDFVRSMAAAAGCGALGGCAWKGSAPMQTAGEISPNYWCTWGTQAMTLHTNMKSGAISFEGDQGMADAADNLKEEIVFGKSGWAKTQWEKERSRLYFVFDHGWDVPYFVTPGKNIDAFGSQDLNTVRFPSITGTPAQKLKTLCSRIADNGWRGTGIWISPQAPGEKWDKKYGAAKLDEYIKRQLAASAEAGVTYWKVDWGVHGREAAYRRRMSELKAQIYPELVMEHCRSQGALNGLRFEEGTGNVTGPLRLFGNEAMAADRAELDGLLACADVFRIYDLVIALNVSTCVERMAYYLEAADRIGSKVLINGEDDVYVAAALGCVFGVMRAPFWGEPAEGTILERETHSRIMHHCAEVTRALNWQKIAPAYNARAGLRTRHSEKTLADEWVYTERDTWYAPIYGKNVRQVSPAVVARGMELPGVKSMEAGGAVPYVVAAKYPNGMASVAALPRSYGGTAYMFPKAEVSIDWTLEPGKAAGLFGHFGAVKMKCAGASRIYASDLAGGVEHDVTHLVKTEGGVLTVPGGIVSKIGKEAAKDESWPGMLLRMA